MSAQGAFRETSARCAIDVLETPVEYWFGGLQSALELVDYYLSSAGIDFTFPEPVCESDVPHIVEHLRSLL